MSTETVVINEEAEGKSLEQSAIEMGILDENGQEPVAESTESRPEWLPEKFNSAEDMAKAYAELESKQSAPAKEAPAEEATEEMAREAVSEAGVDFDALSAEYFQNEGLTEDSYGKLAEAGIPREIVDQFIAGQEAAAAQQRDTILSEIGGQSTYDEMTSWAADNFSEAEIDAFNDTVEGGNAAAVRMAVAGLKARFEADRGVEPTRMVGGEASTGGDNYRSVAELMTDMQDARYHNDPAFRADVERKLARSEIM